MRPILLALAALSFPLAAQAPRDLSGAWVRADTTAEPPAPAADTSAARPRPTLDRRDGVDPDRRQIGLLLGMAGAVPAFHLAQADSTLTVTNDDGFRYMLTLGGEGHLMLTDSLTVRHHTRWDGTTLEVVWRPDGGGTLTERYQLADSGDYLRVDVTVEYERFRRWDARLYRREASDDRE